LTNAIDYTIAYAIVLLMNDDSEHPILIAANVFGSQRAMAEILEIHPSMISQIARGRRKVPAPMCRRIELLTSGLVTRYQLRPDIFGEPSEAA